MTAQPATQVVMVEAGAIRPGAPAIARAAQTLAAGGLAAFPTETVYGLGADATNGAAVARLYAAKERPSFNPLIAHVPDAAAAHALARFDPAAERLAAAFWPGPLTLALPKRADRAPRSAGAAAAFGRAASACRRATDRARRSCRATGLGDAGPGVPIPAGNGPPGVCLRLRQRRSRHASCAGCFLCDAL
jgi:threonylcarbamoyl-AMP synthase-like protein